MHVAVGPWEATGAPFLPFAMYLTLAGALGLLVGAIIDNGVSKIQGSETTGRLRCGGFFLLQILINVVLLYVIINYVRRRGFVPWMLITLSGFLFGLLLFTVQNTLNANALCVVQF